MLGKRIEPWVGSFRCPTCENTPKPTAENDYFCSKCQVTYPVKNGCPIFLDKDSLLALENELSTEHGQLMLKEYATAGKSVSKGLWQKISGLITPPQVLYDYNPDLSKSHTLPLFNHKGRSSTSILNVGGGPRRYSDIEITMNLSPFYNVDIVGDAHNIPFEDNSFDTVICNAVLEHVHAPEQVVEEMYRVLKPDGLMYAEVPFVFFFHGYPNDFKRYTLEGMKRLFSMLSNSAFGMTQGPISSSLQCGNIALESMIPARYSALRKIFNGVYRWVFFWFKYLDKFMEDNPDAHKVAGGFYVLGRKPSLGSKEHE